MQRAGEESPLAKALHSIFSDPQFARDAQTAETILEVAAAFKPSATLQLRVQASRLNTTAVSR